MAKLSCVWLSAFISFFALPVEGAETRYFSHADERYLYPHQQNGAAALLPEDATWDSAIPLVVFLHGTNSSGEPHLWLGGGGRDLRPLASRLMKEQKVRQFVLAGPSQTKGAALPHTLWNGFDLGAFVDDVAAAIQGAARIDRSQVVVVGHSGAGCNPSGGLATQFWSAARVTPFALGSIDPCLDDEMGRALAKRSAKVPLFVWWQSAIWERNPEAFWAALVAGKPAERVDLLTSLLAQGRNPHEAIVPLAFEKLLREVWPSPPSGTNDEAVAPE